MQANPTYPIPLTWDQWRRLGHQNVYLDFHAYGQNVIQGLFRLFRDTGPSATQTDAVTALAGSLRQLTAAVKTGAVVLGPAQPPTSAMVAAVNDLLDGLVVAIGANMASGGSQEDAQSKWSPLNKSVIKQLDDADLILASSGNVIGWQPAWATHPILVNIMDPVVIPEIRALSAFILCSDDVVGRVISDDERGAAAAVNTAVTDERRYTAALVADGRPANQRRTFECQIFGTMRSWHIDILGFLTGKRAPAVDGARRTAYQTRNQQEFAVNQGIAVPIDEIPGKFKQDGHPVPKGLTEFNVLFGTNGRLIFDYDAGDFYLSGHYQEYPVPDRVLTQAQQRANDQAKAAFQPTFTCYPYFKLTHLDQIELDWTGHVELGRLRYWENQRRARHRGTIGE